MLGTLTYEIRPIEHPRGGVRLDLYVEGSWRAMAITDVEALLRVEERFGISRDGVAAGLTSELEAFARHEVGIGMVSILDVRPDPLIPLCFYAHYHSWNGRKVAAGVAWYDVTAETVGPEDLSPLVRNRVRTEVHRMLTSDGGVARALVDLHE